MADAVAGPPSVPVSLLFSFALSLVSGALAAGGVYGALAGQVAHDTAAIVELRTSHEAMRSELALSRTSQQVAAVELAGLRAGVSTTSILQQSIVRIEQRIDALCRANRAANCGP